jgi:hypothetical protein
MPPQERSERKTHNARLPPHALVIDHRHVDTAQRATLRFPASLPPLDIMIAPARPSRRIRRGAQRSSAPDSISHRAVAEPTRPPVEMIQRRFAIRRCKYHENHEMNRGSVLIKAATRNNLLTASNTMPLSSDTATFSASRTRVTFMF